MKHYILFAILLTSCTFDGKVSTDSIDKIHKCTDLRDGETFVYRSADMKDVRIGVGGAPSSATIIDTSGVKRYVDSNMTVHFKCVEL